MVPLNLIIKILSKCRFCTYTGYPLSKSSWTTCTDKQIVERFKRMRNSLTYYYSGCVNNNTLLRIYHILRYSCAKTLACKHKTTVKLIWQNYGQQISVNTFYKNKQAQISLCITLRNLYQSKVWHLDLSQQNVFAFFL